jgi:hypothetical protein
MLVLFLTLMTSTDASTPPAPLHGPQPEPSPSPAWVYFGVAAGLSLTSSVLLFFPELALAILSPTASAIFVLAAAPIVVGFGLERLDPEHATVPIVGAVIGDVVGAVVGGFAGALFFGPALTGAVPRSALVDDERALVIGFGGGALAGAWISRALGAGAGAAIGRIASSTLQPLPQP